MKHANLMLVLLTGVLLGTVTSPWTLPFLSELTGKADARPGYRVPELKIDLSSEKGTSEVMIWKSVIAPATSNSDGLPMHRHNYARTLIPLTEGVLQRRDADGKITDYVLTPGKPVPLPADTPQGFHTDDNFGKTPIEVMVVQFNQSNPVVYSPLTEGDIKSSIVPENPTSKESSSGTLSLQDNVVLLNKHKIHYYVVGKGKPLVLLTGYGVTSNFWSRPFIECLSKDHSVYLVDYQGIGTGIPADPALTIDMLADDTNNFINQLHLERPHVVGWSMGGAVALQLAVDHPNAMSELTLFSPLMPNAAIYEPQPAIKPKFNSQDDVLNFVFGNNIYGYSHDELDFYKPQILNAGKTLFPDAEQNKLELQAINTWVNKTVSEKIKHIQVPITFVLSDHDTKLNHTVQLNMIKDFPRSNAQIVENAGHAAFYNAPQAMCEIVGK